MFLNALTPDHSVAAVLVRLDKTIAGRQLNAVA